MLNFWDLGLAHLLKFRVWFFQAKYEFSLMVPMRKLGTDHIPVLVFGPCLFDAVTELLASYWRLKSANVWLYGIYQS